MRSAFYQFSVRFRDIADTTLESALGAKADASGSSAFGFLLDPVAVFLLSMHTAGMKRLAIIILVLASLAVLYLKYTGFVIVDDKTGIAAEVHLTNTSQKQALVRIPFGYFVGNPELEGSVEVICSDGSKVHGGYVTHHSIDTFSVTGDGTCEKLK